MTATVLQWTRKIHSRVRIFIQSAQPYAHKIRLATMGSHPVHSTYDTSTWLFVRGLAFVYAVAFLSLSVQLFGLIGSEGISPAQEYFTFLRQAHGPWVLFRLPSLFWILSADWFLMSVCVLAFAASLAAMFGFLQVWMMGFCWVAYLSFSNATSDFLAFQWDQMLLEMGFLSVFLASWQKKSWNFGESGVQVPALIRRLYLWLLFRVFYFSGAMKIWMQDPSWANLSAVQHHLETQPLPSPIAWYLLQGPSWILKILTAVVPFYEILTALLFLGPRRIRFVALGMLLCHQSFILLTGNFGFLNVLIILLGSLVLDDQCLLIKKISNQISRPPSGAKKMWPRAVMMTVLILGLIGTGEQLPRAIGFNRIADHLKAGREGLKPIRSFNFYSLFSSVPVERRLLSIEGSNNRIAWFPYSVRFRADIDSDGFGWFAPHHPRLDWQLWMAALSHYSEHPWLLRLCDRILKNSKPVLSLFKNNPFAEGPPRYVQGVLYSERMSTREEQKSGQGRWIRKKIGVYLPPAALQSYTG